MVSTMTNVEQVKIPAGYKQTEVGVIPEDWGISTVNNVSLVPMQNGLFYEPQRKGQGVPLINVGDMYASAPIDVSSLDLFDATHSEIKVFKVQKGDLFFTRSSIVPSGIAYCNTFKDEDAVAVFDSHLIRVRPDQKVMDADFLYLNCIANHSRKFLISSAKTATMTTIDQGAIKKCPVLVPPFKEQTAIANALSDVDKLIAALETLIAKKSAIKTAAMQQLLTGKKRLPAFAGEREGQHLKANEQCNAKPNEHHRTQPNSASDTPAQHHSDAENNHQHTPRPGYKHTELGEIPEDWEVVGLGYLFENKVTRKRITEKDEVTFVGMQDVTESAKISNRNKVKYADVKSGFTYFERNDVLVAKITPCFENGKGAFTDVLETDIGFGSTEFHVLRATSDTDSKYLYYFTNTEKFRKELEGEMVGSAGHRRVPLSSIQSYQVAISKNIKEQTAIANVLSDMDAELDALQQRLAKTQAIKQGMMQELLTGKTRLV